MTASTRPEPTSDSAVTTAATPLAQPFIDGLSAGSLRYQHLLFAVRRRPPATPGQHLW